MINLLHEFFDLRDPLTPDQLNMMMELVGVMAALQISAVMALPLSYGHSDFQEAIERFGINVTTGESPFESSADPYAYWIQSTSWSYNALFGVLMLTTGLLLVQSTMNFNVDGNYSPDLRRVWWKGARFVVILDFLLLWVGMYNGVGAFCSCLNLMMPQTGHTCPVNQGVFPILFDFDWENKYKFNLSCRMYWSMGWFVNIFGYIFPGIILSISLALVRQKSKANKPGKPKVVPRRGLQQLLKEQGDMQQRLLELQVEMQRTQGRIMELVSGADAVKYYN
jgi:hypothetical protein